VPRRRASPLNYPAIADFRYAIRRFLTFSAGAAREAGLEPQQYQLLLALKGLPSTETPTIGTLAARMLIQHHSAVELINRLEGHRLIRRSLNPADQREVLLVLSARGERIVQTIAAEHWAELQIAGRELIGTLEEILGPSRAPRQRRKSRSIRAQKNRRTHS
jgi:DNA-binding MarR family transcriptional regulator